MQTVYGSLVLHAKADKELAGPNSNYSVRKLVSGGNAIYPFWERLVDGQLAAIKTKGS